MGKFDTLSGSTYTNDIWFVWIVSKSIECHLAWDITETDDPLINRTSVSYRPLIKTSTLLFILSDKTHSYVKRESSF